MMDPEYRHMVEELNNQQVYLHMEVIIKTLNFLFLFYKMI